jgi:hypothetical protein
MKAKALSILMVAVLLLVTVIPASAQLGQTDTSSITVQNVDTSSVSVTIQFIAPNGDVYQPLYFDNLNPQTPNPFSLDPGYSRQIYVPNIPIQYLPAGQYSVVIYSTGAVVAMAGVAGDNAGNSRHFVGSYSGFAPSEGSTTAYLAVANYNASGWYSMISVQNLGTAATTASLTLTCSNTSAVGTLTSPSIAEMASYTFVLKNTVPNGFTSGTSCNGSAQITASQNIVVVNNQNIPTGGNTISYGGASAGASPLFIANLQNAFGGWNSALNIRKVGSGSTTVTINYSDSEPDDTCNLSDASPGCNLYMPSFHPTTGRFSAIVTSSNPAVDLLAVVGSSRGTRSGAVVGVASGSHIVTAPLVTKNFYGWTSAINCQNVSPTPTTLNIAYQGKTPYNNPTTLNEGESLQIATSSESILGSTFSGGVTITANAVGALIACTIGNTNSSSVPGDWTNQYNAFSQ